MKIKRVEKKLFLNKKTVAHLNNLQMGNIKGAEESTTCDTCDTCLTNCTCTQVTCVWTVTGCYCTGHKTCDTYLCPVSETCVEICY